MNRTRKVLGPLFACLLIAPMTVAQTQGESKSIRIDTPPTYVGTYDLQTDTLIPPAQPPVQNAHGTPDLVRDATAVDAFVGLAGSWDPATGTLGAASPSDGDPIYDNTTFLGSLFLGGTGFIELDWGIPDFGADGASVDGIQIGYATRAAGPVDLTIRLHEGAEGFGSYGSVIYQEDLTGLPGSSTPGSFEAFVIDIDLSSAPLTLQSGPLGWSYQAFDDDTGPLLVGPPNADGVENAWDEYDSLENYVGTFWFGGTPFASFYMQLSGEVIVPPETVYDNTAFQGSLFLGGTGFIELDWGVPNFGGGATVSSIVIGYATRAAGPVDLAFRLHDGAEGFGSYGTVSVNELLTGLPGSSTPGSFEAFTIAIEFDPPLDIPDGALGWSYQAFDDDTGPLLVGPPNGDGVENAWDEYDSLENYVGTFWFGGTPFASFYLEMIGNFNVPPPDSAWLQYGEAGGTFLNGVGPGTPGSTDNEIRIKGLPDTLAVLVVGLNQSEVVGTQWQMTFWAFPWLVELPPVVIGGAPTGQTLGTAVLPAPLPASAPIGLQLYMQAFSQNLGGVFKRHSQGLELTILSP